MEIKCTKNDARLFWQVQDGAAVKKGQVLGSQEAGKGTMMILSPGEGVLHQLVAEGEAITMGQVLATIG